jgi:hypothetical protein
MNAPAPSPRRRAPRRWAALPACLALLLAACGPGVGGTGTGSEPAPTLAGFGATAAALCDSPVASALGCVPPVNSTDSAQALPLPLWLSDAEPATRAIALVFANQIELQLRCDALQFSGQWGRADSDGSGRFYGQAQTAAGTPLRATLTLEPGPGGLLATLRRADGSLLAAPVPLTGRAGPPAAGPCP